MGDPHVVLFDLETVPNLPEALKVWPQLSNYPGITLRASITSIICAGYKTLGSAETKCICAWDFPSWDTDVNDDRALCEAIYEVLKEADCVVTHNGKKFDWKFLQTRLMFHELPPLPPIHHVDTRAEASRNLFVFNNKLDTIAKFLTSEKKMENGGWDLWVRVHSRESEAMQLMKDYCMQDVIALEAVFKRLRPLVKSLPNHNLFSPMKEKSCPNCGSTRLRPNGRRYTQTRAYHRYICEDCRRWSHTDLKDEVPR